VCVVCVHNVCMHNVCVCVCAVFPYMRVLLQKVKAMLVDSENTRGVQRGGATALDVEEGGAKHGEGADQP